ncbi:MAG: hypothetical protein EPN82_12825 [Bacteroidetes bacterium]|nr:MAG: hypothetical protein EPN82_12825 [Bacteroidota bacterium]
MSSIGLNTNIYHSTRTYLDLLNNFLIDLNYSKELGQAYSNDAVIDFFRKLTVDSNIEPELQMIRSFFNRFYKEKRKDFKESLNTIILNVGKSEINEDILKEIIELIDVLKFQCAISFARMKGTDRI